MTLRSLAAGAALLGVALLGACGDDDGPLSEDEYADAVRAISERRDDDIATPVEAIGQAVENQSPEAATGVVAEQLPAIIATIDRSIGELEALTPPERYAADHERLLAAEREMAVVRLRMLEATQAGEFLRVRALQEQQQASERRLAAELSEAFRESVFVSESAADVSALFGGLEQAETEYVNALRAGMNEFGRRATVFAQRLRQQFANTAAFFDALEGAGAGTAFEAAQTAIVQIDPPPAYQADHSRVLEYLDEAVRLDREVGRSIEEGDVVLFAVSNIGLGRNSSLTAIDVAPSVCAVLGSPASLCRVPDEVPGGEYGSALYAALREFSAAFGADGPLQPQLELLTFISDAELFALVAAVTPDLETIAADARGAVIALVAPAGMAADHDLLVQYFDQTLDALRSTADAAAASDRGGVLARSREVGELRERVAGELSDAVEPIVAVHFGPPGGPVGAP